MLTARLKRLEKALVARRYYSVIKVYSGQAILVKDCAGTRRCTFRTDRHVNNRGAWGA